MVRPIVKDSLFLSKPSVQAGPEDLSIARDLIDTLSAHRSTCVGMAANMIGFSKRIIAIAPISLPVVMINPRILHMADSYSVEEGCLCHQGTQETQRFRHIEVTWEDMCFETHTASFDDFVAQIIQHEMDHLEGILI